MNNPVLSGYEWKTLISFKLQELVLYICVYVYIEKYVLYMHIYICTCGSLRGLALE